MLQFSSEIITYTQDQITQTFTVTNKSQTQILFKIKTNNIKAIDARPNTGSILPNANCKVTIKRNQHVDDNVKLQVTFLECPEAINKDNFKELWGKFQKGQSSKTFPVKVVGGASDQKQSQKKQVTRNVQRFNSVISNSDSDPTLFQTVRISHKTQQPHPQQPNPQSKSNPDLQQKSLKSSEQLLLVTQKYQQQKKRNLSLQQEVLQKQNEIKKINQGKQFQINKFLKKQNCSRVHLNLITLLILVVLCFGAGFYFGTGRKQSVGNL